MKAGFAGIRPPRPAGPVDTDSAPPRFFGIHGIAGSVLVYSCLFGTGKLLFGARGQGAVLLSLAAAAGAFLWRDLNRLTREPEARRLEAESDAVSGEGADRNCRPRSGRLILPGLIFGTASSLVAVRFIEGLLYNVPSNDPATSGGVIACLAAAAFLAGTIPAWRAGIGGARLRRHPLQSRGRDELVLVTAAVRDVGQIVQPFLAL